MKKNTKRESAPTHHCTKCKEKYAPHDKDARFNCPECGGIVVNTMGKYMAMS